MGEGNIELSIKKKIKNSGGKKFLRILGIILFLLFSILVLFVSIMGDFEIKYLLYEAFLAFLVFRKYKNEQYRCQAVVNILENNTVEFMIKNFRELSGKTYDLKILFPISRIDYMYIDDNLYEKEVFGGNISGYPLLHKEIEQIKEDSDCSINKEKVNIIYFFKNNKELIDKLQEIRKTVVK